jgi:predicted PurR-regulated permease PerM
MAVVMLLGPAFGVLGTILAVPTSVASAILVKRLWFEQLAEGKTNT